MSLTQFQQKRCLRKLISSFTRKKNMSLKPKYMVLFLSLTIKNNLMLWCFNCNYTVSNCNTVENVILSETEDNYCTIGFIGETIVFRVSIK